MPDTTHPAPLCASCGDEIRTDWVIRPSLCPGCEDKIQQADTAWTKTDGRPVKEPHGRRNL